MSGTKGFQRMFETREDGKDLQYTFSDESETDFEVPVLKHPTTLPEFMNICPFRAVFSGGAGLVLGSVIGIFFAALGHDPLTLDQRQNLDWKRQMKLQWKDMKSRSRHMSRQFATIGFLYSGIECAVSKYRAKQDMMNHVYTGCATGAGLAVRGGPSAMCLGCGGFAAFSVVIEKFMEPEHDADH